MDLLIAAAAALALFIATHPQHEPVKVDAEPVTLACNSNNCIDAEPARG